MLTEELINLTHSRTYYDIKEKGRESKEINSHKKRVRIARSEYGEITSFSIVLWDTRAQIGWNVRLGVREYDVHICFRSAVIGSIMLSRRGTNERENLMASYTRRCLLCLPSSYSCWLRLWLTLFSPLGIGDGKINTFGRMNNKYYINQIMQVPIYLCGRVRWRGIDKLSIFQHNIIFIISCSCTTI